MKIKKIAIIVLLILLTNICCNNFAEASTQNNTELDLYSESAILIDSNTGTILYSKNSDEKMYPASTTKILTAIIAIENCNLLDSVTINSSSLSSIPSGYSSAYLSQGEEISINDLLKLFLVHSANDAGYVLAEHISGSIDNFAVLMNEKVSEIGCKNTHFTNPSGIHDENHYTTAYDMALIAKYCMKNNTFRNFVSMASCTIPATNKSDSRYYINTNDLLNSSSKYYLENCTGIKTGYTTQAKNCLISSCKENNLELICVVLGASTTETGASARYVDTHSLFEYGFKNYSLKNILTKNNVITSVEVSNGTKESRNVNLLAKEDLIALVKNNEIIDEPKISLNQSISAPIGQNETLGTITYTINGISYSVDLITEHNVEKSDLLFYILILLLGFIILVFFLCLLKKHKKKTKKRKREKK